MFVLSIGCLLLHCCRRRCRRRHSRVLKSLKIVVVVVLHLQHLVLVVAVAINKIIHLFRYIYVQDSLFSFDELASMRVLPPFVKQL